MKIRRIILILVIILLIFLVILSTKYMQRKKAIEEVENQIAVIKKENVETYEKYISDKIIPNGVFELSQKYNGERDINDFYKQIKVLAENNMERLEIEEVNTSTVRAIIDTKTIAPKGYAIDFEMDLIGIETGKLISYNVEIKYSGESDFVVFTEK